MILRFEFDKRLTLLCLLGLVLPMAGCRRQDPAKSPALRVDSSRESPRGAASLAAAPKLTLTSQQQASLQRILEAGGSVPFDEQGYPAAIDLASDRPGPASGEADQAD